MTNSGAKLVIVVTAACCAGGLLWMPRAVAPREPPSLTLNRHQAQRIYRADRAAAARVPQGDDIRRFRHLLARQGRAEGPEGEPDRRFRQRIRALRSTVKAIRQRHGDAALRGLRAEAVARFEQALGGGLSGAARRGVLGSFPRMMKRYDLVREGRVVAPRLVLRTLYKARWNALCGLPLSHDLGRLERRAYWGWLALHAADAPLPRRLEALRHYADAGGTRTAEARGVLLFHAGRYAQAARALARARKTQGSFRVRNHHRAALAAVDEDAGGQRPGPLVR